MSKKLEYRRNVAIVVINDEGQLLACHRNDSTGIWQIPQGGVDEGESDEQAMFRELEEEIGTQEVHLIGQLKALIQYDWPDELIKRRGFHGQIQRYFLVRLKKKAKINLSHPNHKAEFDQCQWLSVSEFLDRVAGFKRRPYEEALLALQREFPDTLLD